jgi:hypothetical protein
LRNQNLPVGFSTIWAWVWSFDFICWPSISSFPFNSQSTIWLLLEFLLKNFYLILKLGLPPSCEVAPKVHSSQQLTLSAFQFTNKIIRYLCSKNNIRNVKFASFLIVIDLRVLRTIGKTSTHIVVNVLFIWFLRILLLLLLLLLLYLLSQLTFHLNWCFLLIHFLPLYLLHWFFEDWSWIGHFKFLWNVLIWLLFLSVNNHHVIECNNWFPYLIIMKIAEQNFPDPLSAT